MSSSSSNICVLFQGQSAASVVGIVDVAIGMADALICVGDVTIGMADVLVGVVNVVIGVVDSLSMLSLM